MDMRKGPMKYVEGGTLKSEKDVGPPMGIGGVGGTPGDEVTRGISIAPEEAPKKKKKEKKKKEKKKKEKKKYDDFDAAMFQERDTPESGDAWTALLRYGYGYTRIYSYTRTYTYTQT